MSKDTDKQLKLTHKVIDVVNRPKWKVCETLLQYNVETPECSYAQVKVLAKKKEDEKFKQIVFVIKNLKISSI